MSVDALRRCPLFAGLKDEDLKKIRLIALPKSIRKKEVLFSEGEEAKGFYVILSGKIKLYKVSSEGKEQILHVVASPDAFAEAALFLEGKYPAFAEAMTDCQLLFFQKRDFIQLIEKNPQLSINMIVSLSHFLKRFASLIEELSLKEISSRVAKYLIDLSIRLSKEGKPSNEIELDVSKTQLASRLGTISETLSRTLAKLRAKGLIDVQRNQIVILNREALEEVASGLKVQPLHPHSGALEVILYGIEGTGVPAIGNEEKPLKKGDLVFCKGEVAIGPKNTGKDRFVVLVLLTLKKLMGQE